MADHTCYYFSVLKYNMHSNLFLEDRYRCYCAREDKINHDKKVASITVLNDTHNEACVSQLSSYGIIRQPLVCMKPKSGVKLDGKISLNEHIKIRTPVTEYYACSGIIKPTENSVVKVSDVERNRWSSSC